jgi:hypothetical protein
MRGVVFVGDYDYPLLPGDLLATRPDGTFGKWAPGLGIEGIKLTQEQINTLEVVEEDDVPKIQMVGLDDYARSCGIEVQTAVIKQRNYG